MGADEARQVPEPVRGRVAVVGRCAAGKSVLVAQAAGAGL
jgi:GTPase Era involved in 16S rRNA processing